jgi:hypothetical protein
MHASEIRNCDTAPVASVGCRGHSAAPLCYVISRTFRAMGHCPGVRTAVAVVWLGHAIWLEHPVAARGHFFALLAVVGT